MTYAPNYADHFKALSQAFDCMALVMRGMCPKCGAVREDNDCRACGHHSLYVPPVYSSVEGGDK